MGLGTRGFKIQISERVIHRFGLSEIYYNLSMTQSLEMIRELRHYEDDYRESLIEFVSETLSLPAMLLLLVFGRSRNVLEAEVAFPKLATQAKNIAGFHIRVVGHLMTQGAIPAGPYAHRICRRWQNRSK